MPQIQFGFTMPADQLDKTHAAALALYTSMGFSASAYFTIARKEL